MASLICWAFSSSTGIEQSEVLNLLGIWRGASFGCDSSGFGEPSKGAPHGEDAIRSKKRRQLSAFSAAWRRGHSPPCAAAVGEGYRCAIGRFIRVLVAWRGCRRLHAHHAQQGLSVVSIFDQTG